MNFFAAILFALPLLVTASPLEARNDGQCSTGPLQCCQSTYSTTSETGQSLMKSCGLHDHSSAHNGVVGSNCSPITGAGIGSTCESKPVCCEAKAKLVAIGCIVVNV